MEVNASTFAGMAGVSAMAISKKIKNGTLIRNSGGKLDTDNPVNRAYLDKHQAKLRQLESQTAQGIEPEGKLSGAVQEKVINRPAGAVTQGTGDNPSKEMLSMTLGELLKRFKTIDNVEKYAGILQKLAIADDREQKTAERRLLQIPKDFVTAQLFNYLDGLMNKLLDVPESVVDQVIALSLADEANRRQDIINLLTDNLSRCIAGSQGKIISDLQSLRGKYDKNALQTVQMQDLVENLQEASRA